MSSVKIIAVPMAVVSVVGVISFLSWQIMRRTFLFLMKNFTFVAVPGVRCCLGFSLAGASGAWALLWLQRAGAAPRCSVRASVAAASLVAEP